MFNLVLSDIYSVLQRPSLVDPNFKFYPANFLGEVKSTEFARVSVLPAKGVNSSYGRGEEIEGLMSISIYTKAGAGDKKSFNTATLLSAEFNKALLANGTQFSVGVAIVKGLDPENKSLHRVDYQNNFFIFRR